MKIMLATNYINMYESRMREVYEAVDPEKLCNILTYEIIEDPKKVSDIVRQWTDTCYVYCGYVALALDYYNIPYKCYIGAAESFDSTHPTSHDQVHRIKNPNHAWIECRGKYYEIFNDYDNINHLKRFKEVCFH